MPHSCAQECGKSSISFQDEKKVDLDLNSASVSLRTLPALNGNAASTIGVAEEDFGVVEHPEILVSLIFMEKLGPNECLKVRWSEGKQVWGRYFEMYIRDTDA